MKTRRHLYLAVRRPEEKRVKYFRRAAKTPTREEGEE